MLLALSTGARKSELLGMRWQEVNLRQGHVTFPRTKSGEIRRVPLTGVALERLRQYAKVRKLDCPYVFPSPRTSRKIHTVTRAWYTVLQQAAIEDLHFHDLRHSAASYLAMSGATLPEIAKVLGHRDIRTTQRYAHLAEQHTREVLNRMTSAYLSAGQAG